MTAKVHLVTTTDPDTGKPVTLAPDCTMTDDCPYCTPETRAERAAAVAAHAPGDFVVILDREAPYALGMVREVFDIGDPDGTMYDVTIPASGPVPVFASEVRAATDDDKAAHHPSWVRFLEEDWAWRQTDAGKARS